MPVLALFLLPEYAILGSVKFWRSFFPPRRRKQTGRVIYGLQTGTDHTREYIPVLVYGKNVKENVDLGVLDSFADIGQTIADILECNALEVGNSFFFFLRRG